MGQGHYGCYEWQPSPGFRTRPASGRVSTSATATSAITFGGGEVHDRTIHQEWWDWYLGRWRLGRRPAPAPPMGRIRAARIVVRGCLEAAGQPSPDHLAELNRLLARGPTVFRLDRAGVLSQAPLRKGWNWVLSATARSAADVIAAGEWRRVKVCGNPACTLIFFDESQNRSRRWCDPSIFGNLVKVRRFRSRQRIASQTDLINPGPTDWEVPIVNGAISIASTIRSRRREWPTPRRRASAEC